MTKLQVEVTVPNNLSKRELICIIRERLGEFNVTVNEDKEETISRAISRSGRWKD